MHCCARPCYVKKVCTKLFKLNFLCIFLCLVQVVGAPEGVGVAVRLEVMFRPCEKLVEMALRSVVLAVGAHVVSSSPH